CATADVDGAVRPIVVVVARALSGQPADQPDVDVRVPVQLVVEALRLVVALERSPERGLPPDLLCQPDEPLAVQVLVGGETFANPGCDLGHIRSLDGLSAVISCTTESPKPPIALRVGSGSITGTSLPYTSWCTPKVSMQSSIARRP